MLMCVGMKTVFVTHLLINDVLFIMCESIKDTQPFVCNVLNQPFLSS